MSEQNQRHDQNYGIGDYKAFEIAEKPTVEDLEEKNEKLSKKVFFVSVALLALSLGFAYSLYAIQIQDDVLLDLQLVKNAKEKVEETIQSMNDMKVTIYVDDEKVDEISLSDLGLELVEKKSLGGFISASFLDKPDAVKYSAQLVRNQKQWGNFVSNVQNRVSVAPVAPGMNYNNTNGWQKTEGQAGIGLDMTALELALQQFIINFGQYTHELLAFRLNTAMEDYDKEAIENNEELDKNIQALVGTPIKLLVGEDTVFLDLGSDEDFIVIEGSQASVNELKLTEWLDQLAKQYYRETNTITIVGSTEPDNAGIVNAITEGEYVEGQRINVKEVKEAILIAISENMAAMEAAEKVEEVVEEEESIGEEVVNAEPVEIEVYVRLYEIPLKVYSELENTEYELLSVGYSEYSKGNAPNRVHNIKHGLGLINGSLVNVGDTISFNKMVGYNWSGFLTGWGIFGTVAKPVLGGGICQVSTTFYRALLNLGIPITMRQNHSWDLSYYQVGGYGIDATVYPAKGLDVKAINDIDSQLFVYAYTRPKTEEAFVLFYGKGDGRKVVLEPEEEYIPWRGAKTLRWTQEIFFEDGTIKRIDIVSRYRS